MDSEMILAQARAARRKIEQAMRYVPSGNAVRNKSGKTVEDVRIYLVVVL